MRACGTLQVSNVIYYRQETCDVLKKERFIHKRVCMHMHVQFKLLTFSLFVLLYFF